MWPQKGTKSTKESEGEVKEDLSGIRIGVTSSVISSFLCFMCLFVAIFFCAFLWQELRYETVS